MTGDDELLTLADVARLFGVEPRTVVRWAKAGRIPCQRTLGGHRRFRRPVIEGLLQQLSTNDEESNE